MDEAPTLGARTRPRRRARVSRSLGTLLIVAGLGMLGWAFSVWKWGDPFTAIYTTLEQRQLDSELATLMRDRRRPRRQSRPSRRPRASRACEARRGTSGARRPGARRSGGSECLGSA